MRRFLCFVVLLALTHLPAYASWPTSLHQDLSVATNPNLYEGYPYTLPYPNGGTLVVHTQEDWGACYQIITRYGELAFNPPRLITPGITFPSYGVPKAISDGQGGAFIVWYSNATGYVGFYAQRIDSLGNRLWGDSGVHFFDFSGAYSISTDGMGGLLVAVEPEGNIKAQRINALGQLLWGTDGVWVCNYQYQQSEPVVTHNGAGGAYIAWRDYRPPNPVPNGALFMQRQNTDGSPAWTVNGIQIDNFIEPWNYDLIPDGQGGCILHGGDGIVNDAYRISPIGAILWTREGVSAYGSAKIIPGLNGFFFLGWKYHDHLRAQKMDMQGNPYWPGFGSFTGALVENGNLYLDSDVMALDYSAPYLYFTFAYGTYSDCWTHAQKLDSLGYRLWSENGTVLCHFVGNNFYIINYPNCSVDDLGGVVGVWTAEYSPPPNKDVWAKRCNADGSLGGPVNPKPHPSLAPALDIIGQSARYTLPCAGEVRLELFDLLGRKVASISETYQPAGDFNVPIESRDLPSGIYLVRLQTHGQAAARKLVLLK